MWHESPEFEAGAFGWGEVRAQQISVFIAWCSVAAWQEQEVTWTKDEMTILKLNKEGLAYSDLQDVMSLTSFCAQSVILRRDGVVFL